MSKLGVIIIFVVTILVISMILAPHSLNKIPLRVRSQLGIQKDLSLIHEVDRINKNRGKKFGCDPLELESEHTFSCKTSLKKDSFKQ